MQTLRLPAIDIADHVTETPLGRLVVPGLSLPERMVVIEPAVIQEMIVQARLAADLGYNSGFAVQFPVGAAVVMADDVTQKIYTAANCENAVLNSGMCAERALLHYVVAQGFRCIKYIVVSTPNRAKDISLRSPCGLCRQTIAEFADDKTLVIIDHQEEGKLADIVDIDRLLPYRYRLEA
jgi:cytidine deaminase